MTPEAPSRNGHVHAFVLQQGATCRCGAARPSPEPAPAPPDAPVLLEATYIEGEPFWFLHDHNDGTRHRHDITDVCTELRVLPPDRATPATPLSVYEPIVKALTYPCREPIHQQAAEALARLRGEQG